MELIGVRRGEDRITLRLSADRDPFLGNLQLTIQACARRMHFCFHSFASVASSFGEVLKTEAVLPCSSTACIVRCGERGIRTLGPVARTTVFETAPIDHSGISPDRPCPTDTAAANIIQILQTHF